MTNPPSDKPRELNADEQRVAGLLEEHFSEVESDPCFDCDLEGFVAGRLDAAARRDVEAHLAECATCREALAVVEELHDEGALEMPPFDPAATAESNGRVVRLETLRSRSTPPPTKRRWWPMLAAAAAVIAVSVSLPLLTSERDRLTAKGDGAVGVAGAALTGDHVALGVLRDGVTFRAASGDELRPGDLVRFFYTAETSGYLAVFHLAADREVSRMYPTDGTMSAAVTAGNDAPLDAGATIEGGDRCEWVIGVFSDAPIDLASASTAVERLAILEPGGCAAIVRVPGAREVSVFAVRQ